MARGRLSVDALSIGVPADVPGPREQRAVALRSHRRLLWQAWTARRYCSL